MTSAPLRVEVARSGFVESVHLVDVAVVDVSGALVASAGDPSMACAFRSSAKPIQAAVSRAYGFAPRDERHLAIACASHLGEAGHVAAVREILADAGLDDDALRCPVDDALPPLKAMYGITDRPRVHFNCSGKHAAMLAACVASGFPTETYLATEHPLQQAMIARMAAACEMPSLEVLVDGCGVPTPVAPLQAFARAFATVAGTDEAAAMRAHPWLVRGTGAFDTALMESVPGAVSKVGAEGLNCVVLGDVAIALKGRDGGVRHGPPATLFVLRALGLVPDPLPDTLAPLAEPVITGGGAPVGALRVVGDLA